MMLPILIDLSLILILTSKSQGQSWNIQVKRKISATLGSDVIIPCNFTYPRKYHTEDVKVYWKKPGNNSFLINDVDKNPFVFHTNETFLLEKYKSRTKLIGNKNEGNCSLKILNIRDSESKLYVRISAKGENYSFVKNFVSITVQNALPVTLGPDTATTYWVQEKETTSMYLAIFLPVAALLVIILVTGLVCYKKRNRSQPLTREESAYYANFSRTLETQARSEASCKRLENKTVPELKVIDEPVYVNLEARTDQVDEHTDFKHKIYENVNFFKNELIL
ncbi:sialic acid-binding Ig-like lectin 12 isoform X2 [Mastacembelus armatus]|uniref:sialic acid-binding Ig-like lectin 12 isoform X2 n=1 Tax=Mastacembelus armatus TaxID=205130 RepID=UPI000E45A7B1|nr:sialic acid-binding Ig-like lectin 12 isoform X2 [Mastacembelus armatus]